MVLKQLENYDTNLSKQRGKGTKYALVMAGLELFGEYGLKATSTRMLAEKSGANVAAIPYHFGSKEGLYKAVVAHISERINAHIDNMAANVKARIEDGLINKKEARNALREIMHILATLFIAGEEPKAWAQVIMREQANPTEAFDVFYEGNLKHMQKTAAYLLAICADIDPDGNEAKIRAHALWGQIIGFLVSRESLLRHMGVKKLSAKQTKLIYHVLDAHIEACLNIVLVEKH